MKTLIRYENAILLTSGVDFDDLIEKSWKTIRSLTTDADTTLSALGKNAIEKCLSAEDTLTTWAEKIGVMMHEAYWEFIPSEWIPIAREYGIAPIEIALGERIKDLGVPRIICDVCGSDDVYERTMVCREACGREFDGETTYYCRDCDGETHDVTEVNRG